MKQAQLSLNILIWFPRIIFLIFIILIVTHAVQNYANTFIDISQPTATILTYRIIGALAERDPITRRTYPLATTPEYINKLPAELLQQQFTTPTLSAQATATFGDATTYFYHNKEMYRRLANIPTGLLRRQNPHYNFTYPLQPTGKLNIGIYTP